MTVQAIRPATLCSIGAHEWTTRQNDAGDHYEVCKGCGKQASWVPLWADDARPY